MREEIIAYKEAHEYPVIKTALSEGTQQRINTSRYQTLTSSFQFSVESNPEVLWFCFTSLCDWSRKLALLCIGVHEFSCNLVLISMSKFFNYELHEPAHQIAREIMLLLVNNLHESQDGRNLGSARARYL